MATARAERYPRAGRAARGRAVPAPLDQDLRGATSPSTRSRCAPTASCSPFPGALDDLARGRLRVLHDRVVRRRPDAAVPAGALRGAAGLRDRAGDASAGARGVRGGAPRTAGQPHRQRAAPRARGGAGGAGGGRRAGLRAAGWTLDPERIERRAGDPAPRDGDPAARAAAPRVRAAGRAPRSASPAPRPGPCGRRGGAPRRARRAALRRGCARSRAPPRRRWPRTGAPQAERWLRDDRDRRLEITGDDLIAAGIAPGPELGRACGRRARRSDDGIADDREAAAAASP